MYATGVMYLSVLNLPCIERYKSENLLVLGIIPGPNEPELTINTYLRPLVDELLQLWSAVVMQTHDSCWFVLLCCVWHVIYQHVVKCVVSVDTEHFMDAQNVKMSPF